MAVTERKFRMLKDRVRKLGLRVNANQTNDKFTRQMVKENRLLIYFCLACIFVLSFAYIVNYVTE